MDKLKNHLTVLFMSAGVFSSLILGLLMLAVVTIVGQ